MINWPKQQPLYERKAYRIIQKHVKRILNKIPVDNADLYNYEILINLNISNNDIFLMFKELYNTIGLDYGNKINRTLEKTTKANILFNEYLLKEILLFLSTDGGLKIESVKNTLIGDVINTIKAGLGENATVIDLQRAIYAIVEKSQTFYKWQALRIARTETTASSNFAAIKTAQNSNLVLQKEWISVMDKRTRLDHFEINETKVELDEAFVMQSGALLQYPGDPNGTAKEVINCRCTIAFTPKRDANGSLIRKI
jgi:hypothetical protein